MVEPFVPRDFAVPSRLRTGEFVLEPLGVQHNQADYAAWTSSTDHIRATPGFAGRDWPKPMTVDENRADLQQHADDFQARTGFTYTVLDPIDGDVIGCVYLYPARDGAHDVDVRSRVRVSHAELDKALYSTIAEWLTSTWPFTKPQNAPR